MQMIKNDTVTCLISCGSDFSNNELVGSVILIHEGLTLIYQNYNIYIFT